MYGVHSGYYTHPNLPPYNTLLKSVSGIFWRTSWRNLDPHDMTWKGLPPVFSLLSVSLLPMHEDSPLLSSPTT